MRVVRAPQIHLKNRELENTKLSAELQMLKSVDVNKENIIAQFKEEVVRLQTCLMEKEEQYREVLAKVSPLVRIDPPAPSSKTCSMRALLLLTCLRVGQGDNKALKEQVRQKEEQLQAAQQQSSLLAAELRDASSARDRTMSELYHMKLETDALRKAKADTQAQCARLERLVEQMKAEEAKQEVKRT